MNLHFRILAYALAVRRFGAGLLLGLGLLMGLAPAPPAAAQQADLQIQDALLWKVSGNGLQAPSYLFGTYHIMDSSYVTKNPVIQERLLQCEQLVGEVDMEDINPMALISQAAMEDTTLKDLLTEAEYKQVEKAVQEASGLPLAMMNKMKPIMVTQTLVMMEFQQALDRQLAQPSDGLDGYLQKVARKNDLSVKGLEKLDEQMDMMMNSLPLDQQADQLVQVVQNRDSLRREVLLLDSCYVHQSLSCLFAISQQSRTVDPNQMTKLVDDRNERWLEAMPAMMQAAPTFFAVGALHLPGEAGLVRQLRQRGYQLAPIPFGSD